MIDRPSYLRRLARLKESGLVKVLTGMRRAGKTGILRRFTSELMAEGIDASRIVTINLEVADQLHLTNAQALLDHVRECAAPEGWTYVLIDEAQEVTGIGTVAYTLLQEGRFDLYLTGSHARLVEQELADVLAGSYVEIPVLPLSFAEYRAARAHTADGQSDARLFARYLGTGGLPCAVALEEDAYALHDYLDGVYHTVLRRDVASQLGKEDPVLLDAIIRQLMNALGEPVSANGLSKHLLASGRSCSDDTVARYLGALERSYAFYRVSRFDLRTHTPLKTQEKYFAADLGLRTLMLGTGNASLAGQLQNVVYLELRRRYREVYVGKHYTRQIDFVAHDGTETAYFQVAPSVLDPTVLDRELAPLRSERDNYPKTLLTLDEVGATSHQGIRQRNVIDWLLE